MGGEKAGIMKKACFEHHWGTRNFIPLTKHPNVQPCDRKKPWLLMHPEAHQSCQGTQGNKNISNIPGKMENTDCHWFVREVTTVEPCRNSHQAETSGHCTNKNVYYSWQLWEYTFKTPSPLASFTKAFHLLLCGGYSPDFLPSLCAAQLSFSSWPKRYSLLHVTVHFQQPFIYYHICFTNQMK